jgi:hypothetical protein
MVFRSDLEHSPSVTVFKPTKMTTFRNSSGLNFVVVVHHIDHLPPRPIRSQRRIPCKPFAIQTIIVLVYARVGEGLGCLFWTT